MGKKRAKRLSRCDHSLMLPKTSGDMQAGKGENDRCGAGANQPGTRVSDLADRLIH